MIHLMFEGTNPFHACLLGFDVRFKIDGFVIPKQLIRARAFARFP